jgi:hypothetical protein
LLRGAVIRANVNVKVILSIYPNTNITAKLPITLVYIIDALSPLGYVSSSL